MENWNLQRALLCWSSKSGTCVQWTTGKWLPFLLQRSAFHTQEILKIWVQRLGLEKYYHLNSFRCNYDRRSGQSLLCQYILGNFYIKRFLDRKPGKTWRNHECTKTKNDFKQGCLCSLNFCQVSESTSIFSFLTYFKALFRTLSGTLYQKKTYHLNPICLILL